MRLAVVAPPWYEVPPRAYGGTEAVVALLVEGLARRGLDVTLFAAGGSTADVRRESVFAEPPTAHLGETAFELAHDLGCLLRLEGFDLVHDHSGTLFVALAASREQPLVHTVHGSLDGLAGQSLSWAASLNPHARLVALSRSQRASAPSLPWVGTCPNGIDPSRYPFHPDDDGYLLFLGRMSPDKGVHRAIEVARAARTPLVIAAKCREPSEHEYFATVVRPLLGPDVMHLGEVAHGDRVRLLQGARALLFPIDWDEPFGLAMIEALACGTPVVATRRGAVPEVVDDGVTGIVVDDWRAMVDALPRADRLDRRAMRDAVERRFSPEPFVDRYLDVYERVLGELARTTLDAALDPRRTLPRADVFRAARRGRHTS